MDELRIPAASGVAEERSVGRRVRLGWYWAAVTIFASCVALGAVAVLLKSPVSAIVCWALAAVWIIPVGASLKVLLGPRVFRAQEDGLRLEWLGGMETVPWDKVMGLQSTYTRSKTTRRHGIGLLLASGKTVCVPFWTDGSNRELYDAVAGRVLAASVALHAADPATGNWPRYAEAPAALRAVCQDRLEGGSGGPFCLYRGPIQKLPQAFRTLRVFLAAMVCIGLVLVPALPGDARPAGGVILVMFLLLLGLTYARGLGRPKGERWILVHDRGMAMLSKDLTGEMEWAEVKEVVMTSQHLAIRTYDGAVIAVADVYDVPLSVLETVLKVRLKAVETSPA